MIDHLRKRATRRHKSNHLALEVKTFFGTSTPVTGSSTESSTQGIDFPLTAVNGIAKRERERKKNLHIIMIQQEQSLSNYAQQDLSVVT
jgi:hypothetical protein